MFEIRVNFTGGGAENTLTLVYLDREAWEKDVADLTRGMLGNAPTIGLRGPSGLHPLIVRSAVQCVVFSDHAETKT